jgi:Bacteriophage related domain of unknown function
MSMIQSIRTALRTRLLTLAILPTERAWEGVPYAPTVGTPWIRDRLTPQTSRQVSLGPYGLIRHLGIWSVDVIVPAGKGTAELDVLADAIVGTFPPGLQVAADETIVTVQRSERSMTRSEPDWLTCPIVMLWQSDTTNTI